MPIGQYNHPLFGLVKFKTKHNEAWVRGDPITFTAGFNASDVITVHVPQLTHVHGANGGKLQFHKRGAKQLLAAFEDIERLGLLKHIDSSAGAYYARLKKPVSGALSKEPSNHSFGIAIDLNSDDKCLGCTTAPVAPVFQNHGFHWGKSFNDPMHYEVMKFIDNDAPSVKDIAVSINGNQFSETAKAIFGQLFIDVSHLDAIDGLKIADDAGKTVTVDGPHGSEVLPKLKFGDLAFAPLPSVLGLAGLQGVYDNELKTLAATSLS